MTGRRSQGQDLILFDPETVRKRKDKFTHSLEHQEDGGSVENINEKNDKNVGEQQLAQEEAMKQAQPARAMKEYSIPTLSNTLSCIVVLEVKAKSFELKFGMIHLHMMCFTQGEQEPFYEAWERFRELLQKCPNHGIIDWM
ncbi:unnamed protein product [Prunus brigantina]